MREITIDNYKLFILSFNTFNGTSFAKDFVREFKIQNPELLKIEDNNLAKEYIFKRYLLH